MVRRGSQASRALPRPSRKLLGNPSRLHDRAYTYLKGLLLDGGLEPGEIISTERVGQALAISRAPATDAIRRLTSEGFVAVLPQIGCRVRTPAPAEVADFFELFALGESFVSRLAAERRSTLAAGDFARECEAIERELDRVASAPDAGAIVEGDGATAESMTRDYLREVGRRVAARLPSDQ